MPHSVSFADGSVKEYTKEYTFTSNLKDNNTNLVLYINGKKVEHNNGVFESSISYTAKDYELKAEAESNYALVGINSTPPTNVKTETKTIETPDQEIENVRIYVTAQDGTLAPYGEGDGGYYTLILTRKNETAELDTVTSSNVDAEVEYDESTKEYIIYTSSSQAQATAVLTPESIGAKVGLFKYDGTQWVAQTNYTDVDANMSVDLGSDIMKNVNNGVYQIRVKAENAESDEEYKAYTLRISTKSGNTGIEQIIIEENKPGHYNSVKHEAVWDGKVPPRDATIKIVPTDKHATITNVVRVKSADSDASIFEPIKQPVETIQTEVQ